MKSVAMRSLHPLMIVQVDLGTDDGMSVLVSAAPVSLERVD